MPENLIIFWSSIRGLLSGDPEGHGNEASVSEDSIKGTLREGSFSGEPEI